MKVGIIWNKQGNNVDIPYCYFYSTLLFSKFFSHTYSLFINDTSWLVGKWACVCVCVNERWAFSLALTPSWCKDPEKNECVVCFCPSLFCLLVWKALLYVAFFLAFVTRWPRDCFPTLLPPYCLLRFTSYHFPPNSPESISEDTKAILFTW